MFCTGAAPTVPGISARFSRPGQPWASVHSTSSCHDSPAPASTMNASSARLDQAHAAQLDLDDELGHVAREDDVAAAAEDELRGPAELGVVDDRAHIGIAAHAHQPRLQAGRPKVLNSA